MVTKVLTDKREILFIISALIIFASLVYIFAATAFNTYGTTNGGNYSSSIFLNISTTVNGSKIIKYNMTCFYNASGGATGSAINMSANELNNNLTGTIWNQTGDSMASPFNVTIDTTTLLGGLTDGRLYNISCYVNNGTENVIVSMANITIDNTPPAVTFVATNISNYGNYSTGQVFLINVSVIDATAGMNKGYVYVNITNASNKYVITDTQSTNWTKVNLTAGGGDYYNASINLTSYPDGKYNITIWANDSAFLNMTNRTYNNVKVNLNNTERIQIAIDTVNPENITIVNTTSTTTTSIVATISAADATSGVDNCVIDSSAGWTITGRGTGTQTLTNTGLECGREYTYTVTCYDEIGHSNTSAATKLSTSPCSTDSSSSPGGSSTTTWKQTFVLTNEQFEQGYSQSMGANERAKVSVSGTTHYVGVKNINDNTVVIEVTSNPVQIELNVGEDAKIDVDDDGYYDLYVKVNSIASSKADVMISYVHEQKEPGTGAVKTGGEIISGGEEESGQQPASAGWNWKWIIVIAVVVIALIIWLVSRKK
jgi:hypothetical protein